MGHLTSCEDFQYIHERESYEVLLAKLKKKKRVSFPGCPFEKRKRPRLQSPKYKVKDVEKEDKPGKPKKPGKTTDATNTVLSAETQSSNPPTIPPESSLNKVAKGKVGKDGFDCSQDTKGDSHGETNGDKKGEPEGQAIDDMPPLEDETEV